jgi:hypothetical protein
MTTLDQQAPLPDQQTPTPDRHAPAHGFTKLGQAVHRRTIDHLPDDTAYARLNKKVALGLTRYVGTMTCFWVFCLLALFSLPAVLSAFSVFKGVFPAVLIKASIIALVAWVAQTFIQLVLLPALMVGQNLQNAAADARAAKTFEDVEDARNCIREALLLLDFRTEGGMKVLLDAIESLKPPG